MAATDVQPDVWAQYDAALAHRAQDETERAMIELDGAVMDATNALDAMRDSETSADYGPEDLLGILNNLNAAYNRVADGLGLLGLNA